MYIFVRKSDRMIVGYANRPVSVEDMERQGNLVFEVDKSEFSDTMLGQTLEDFDTK